MLLKYLALIAVFILISYLVGIIAKYLVYLKQSKKKTEKTGRQKAIDIYKKNLTKTNIKILKLKNKK